MMIKDSKQLRFVFALSLLTGIVSILLVGGKAYGANSPKSMAVHKLVIGPTVIVEEPESDITFAARVDTGATSTSIHVEAVEVENESKQMSENVGKKIRFRLKNERGESEWLERKIVEVSVIKTSEKKECRYKVPVTLICQNVKKRVLVSLNDRSHMQYPVLLGRNYLQDDFVVDVSLKQVERSGGKPKLAKVKERSKQERPEQERATSVKK